MWATSTPGLEKDQHTWCCSNGCDWCIATATLVQMVEAINRHFLTNHPAKYGADHA